MDDPNEENIEYSDSSIEYNWVIVNQIDVAEEATALDMHRPSEENCLEKNLDAVDSDVDSDGISIISESSHLHECNTDDENGHTEKNTNNTSSNIKEDNESTKSASKSKTNWTFVDSEVNLQETNSSKQFYLNCLQEPVQELSEHELGSIQSDLDSDGISIISDCESLNDFIEDDPNQICQGTLKNKNAEIDELETSFTLPTSIKKYCNGVVIGTVLLAVTSIFLGQYYNSSKQIEDDLPIYKEKFSNNLKKKVHDSLREFKQNYDVPTALVYCKERHKSDDIFMEHNIKKCLRKIEKRIRKKESIIKNEEMKKREKYLKIKEQYLEEKEKFLIKKEYELLQTEMKLKQKKTYKHERNTKDKTRTDNDFNMKTGIFKNTEEKKYVKVSSTEQTIKDKNYKIEKLKYNSKKTNFRNNKTTKHKLFPFDEKRGAEGHVEKHKLEVPPETTFYKGGKNKTAKFLRPKNTKKSLLKETNTFTRKINLNKEKDKIHENRIKDNINYFILEKGKGNYTVSGYWLGKMYKARSDLRSKEHSSDWYFDRVSYRKKKRDKAKWYFDWMLDRELLRYKRTFHI